MNYKYIVYCTTCTVNGKIYIGVHKTKDPNVFDGYIGNGLSVGWNIKHPTTAFQYAVKKYGYSKFRRSVLYVYDTAEDAYAKEAEIVTLPFVKRDDNYNTSIGGIISGIVYKSIYQYDLEGHFVKEWNSVNEAIEYYRCNRNRFNMVINDKRSAFNSFWSYEYKDTLDVSEYRISKHSDIYCYDINGEFIRFFETPIDAANEFHISKTSINNACSHKEPVKGMFFISDGSNIIDIIKKRNLIHNLTDYSVSKYKNGKLIQTYLGLKTAARENNISVQQLKKLILSNDKEWSYGYSKEYTNATSPIKVKIDQFDLNGNYVKTWESMNQCMKEHPKVKQVLSGCRKQTHGYTFKVVE